MFVIPSILITSPIFETEETSLPIITLSRHIEETSEDLRNGDAVSEEQFAPVNEPDSIFPRSIFDAARSEDPLKRQNVESFIQSRLAQVAGGGCKSKCSALVTGLEESLECPVCRDRVSGHVYQCHAGHVMCSHCRSRLLTCPVCRSLLTLPPIRNRALERLARIIG